jgi:hypothetical protein
MSIALAFSLAISAAFQQSSDYVWQNVTPGESVQWGEPGGARRGLRIECRPGGRFQIFGPTTIDAMPGVPARVTFRNGGTAVTLLAVAVDTEDGLNFALPVEAGELPIATLLAGATLTISAGDESWAVPGAGAPAVLAPLVEACRRR